MEIEIGRGKKARRAYGFDDIAIVPSRRTRDPDDVDISWKLGDYRFELPLLASAMDGVVSPETARIIGKLGGLAVLNLEGIWTRYEDADEQLERIAQLPKDVATREMQEIYQEPIKPELIAQRIEEIKAERRRRRRLADAAARRALLRARARRRPRHPRHPGHGRLGRARLRDRPTPLNLKEFIARGRRSRSSSAAAPRYHTGLHLMRTGAAGVLVGVGPGAACTTRGVLGHRRPAGDGDRRRRRRALAAHARDRRVRPGHRRRRHAHRRRRLQGDRLRRRRRDDRLAARPRLRGARPRLPLGHGDVPSDAAARRARADRRRTARSRRSSPGPAHENDGTFNLMGALRTSMATCGYKDIAEFNRAELMIAPALQTEGKELQRRRASAWARAARRRPRTRAPTNGAVDEGARAERGVTEHGHRHRGDRRDRARRRVGAGRRPARGRRGRRPRLRRPVLAADRAPRARVRRLLASCCRTTSAPRRSRGAGRRA